MKALLFYTVIPTKYRTLSNKYWMILYNKLHWYDNRHMIGYLTPREILYLFNLKVSLTSSGQEQVKDAIQHLKHGLNHGTWFYFIPSLEFRNRFDIRKGKTGHDSSPQSL